MDNMNNEEFHKSIEEIMGIIRSSVVIDSMLELCKLCNRLDDLYDLGVLYANPEILKDIPEFTEKINKRIDKLIEDSARE
jgi:hypothetical protein